MQGFPGDHRDGNPRNPRNRRDRRDRLNRSGQLGQSGQRWRGMVVWASPLLILGLVILSGLAGSRWFLNHGPLPTFVREQIQSTLAKGFGPNYRVVVGAVSFFNPVRVGVERIEVMPAGSSEQPLRATQVEMTLRWQSLVQRLLGNRQAPLPVTSLAIQRLQVDSATFSGVADGADSGPGGVGSWLGGADDPASRDPEAALSKWNNRSVTVLVNRIGRLLGLNSQQPARSARLETTRTSGSAPSAPAPATSAPATSAASLPRELATATAVADRLAIPSTKDFSIGVGALELTRSGQLRTRLTHLTLTRDGERLALSGQLRLPAYPVAVQATVAWPATDQPQVNLTAQLLGPVQLPLGGQPLVVQEGLLRGVWQGDSLQVSQWRLASAQALLVGDGRIEPGADGKGQGTKETSWRHPYLHLQVRQGRLNLPEGLPFLAAYGARGKAQVTGALTGPLQDPSFAGQLSTGVFQLFGRPVRQVSGTIQVDRRQVEFVGAKVVGGREVDGQPTEYQVDGVITYPQAGGEAGSLEKPTPVRTAASGTEPAGTGLDLTVRTQRGLLEEWLPAFLPSWDVQGEVAGVLTVKGPAGQAAVVGDLLVHRGIWRQLHFDEARVAFRWENGSLTLEHSTAKAGGSQLTVSGHWDGSADQMSFQLRGDGLPLSAGQARRSFLRLPALPRAQAADPSPTAVSGEFGIAGTLDGSMSQPRFVGTVKSDGFAVAGWQFDQANGRVQWDGQAVWVDGLFAHRQGGGTYTLSGRVEGVQWPNGINPQLDLDLQVDGEPAGQLLSLTQLNLPLVDGTVYGRGKVRGSLDNPQLVANLALQNGHLLGRPVDVGMDVVLEDHQVNVKQLHFSGSAWSVENGRQQTPGEAG